MSRLLPINRCWDCTKKNTCLKIALSMPNKVLNEIHPDCPLPQGDFVVNKKDKKELVEYARCWTLELYDEGNEEEYNSMFRSIEEAKKEFEKI